MAFPAAQPKLGGREDLPTAEQLAPVMGRMGVGGTVSDVRRLSGGANLESWRFACGAGAFVLRRAPSAKWMKERQIDLATEAQVIRLAHASGVAAPEVIGDLLPADGLGIGFIMRAIDGTSDPKTVIAEAKPAMIEDLARSLARVHALDTNGITLPLLDPGEGIERLADQFQFFGGDRPVIALGLAWLRAQAPAPFEPRLNHGDLRIGNILAEEGQLTGILDWELAHLGDPHEDLAFGCMAVWRFGAIDKPAFGIADLDSFFAAYEEAGGQPVDRDRFRFWLVYRTVWWALGCLRMGSYWREGTDRSLERVVVGRRTVEQELELLLLLENGQAATPASGAMPHAQNSAEPLGEPTAEEIMTAVSEWLSESVKPMLHGRDRFNLAVAQNALGIVRRELANPVDVRDRALADDILAGRVGLDTHDVIQHLRAMTLRKLASDMPKYPSLPLARARWGLGET